MKNKSIIIYIILGLIGLLCIWNYLRRKKFQESEKKYTTEVNIIHDSLVSCCRSSISEGNLIRAKELVYEIKKFESNFLYSAYIQNRIDTAKIISEIEAKRINLRNDRIKKNNLVSSTRKFCVNFPDSAINHLSKDNYEQWYTKDYEYSISDAVLSEDSGFDEYELKNFQFRDLGLKLIDEKDYDLDGHPAKIYHTKFRDKNIHLFICVANINTYQQYLLFSKEMGEINKITKKSYDFFDSFVLLSDENTTVKNSVKDLPINNALIESTKKIIENNLENVEKKQEVIITSPNNDVLYIGVPNPLEITAPGIEPENIYAEISKGSITRKKSSQWIANCKNQGVVTISCYSKNDKKLLADKKFTAKYVPNPIAYLSYKDSEYYDGKISKDKLKEITEIKTKIPNFSLDFNYHIIEYTLVINKQTYVSHTAAITAQQKECIDKLKSGDVITFKNIKVKAVDGRTPFVIGSLCFTIE